MMRIIDLSLPLENNAAWAPWWARNRVKYQDHKFSLWVTWLLLGVGARYFRTGLAWANETITLSTHGTTHVDAPYHYGPLSEGKPAATIDQIPLKRFYGPGVVLDISHLNTDAAASAADLQAALSSAGHDLQPGDIVLVKTGNDQHYGTRSYFSRGPGVSAEATRWLLDQGVKLTGIDSWGWDAPLHVQAKKARQTGRNDIFWEAHMVGVDQEYSHMERLANLDELPSSGFTVCAFPLKVKGGSAGPARVVAMIEE